MGLIYLVYFIRVEIKCFVIDYEYGGEVWLCDLDGVLFYLRDEGVLSVKELKVCVDSDVLFVLCLNMVVVLECIGCDLSW